MGMSSVPLGQIFGLLFMTMGPLRPIAVFSPVDETDTANPSARGGKKIGCAGCGHTSQPWCWDPAPWWPWAFRALW